MKSAALKNTSLLAALLMAGALGGAGVGAFNTLHSPAIAAPGAITSGSLSISSICGKSGRAAVDVTLPIELVDKLPDVIAPGAAIAGECRVLNAPTPAPPRAPAINRAATRDVFFRAADFMELTFQL